MAERVGFEPTIRETRIPEFQSGAFDHSATSPGARQSSEVATNVQRTVPVPALPYSTAITRSDKTFQLRRSRTIHSSLSIVDWMLSKAKY